MLPLNEQAYNQLQNLILKNELVEDQIYSETKLSKEFGISRTPLRDAIHRLAQEGYIDIIPSKGFVLHQLSRQDATETFQIRSALETYCTMQIALNYQTEKAQKLFYDLNYLMDKLKKIIDSDRNIDDFTKYDFQFHVMIIEFLENRQFTSIFSSYMYRMRRLATMSLSHEQRMENTYHEHMNILETMKSGDTEHIIQVTLEHMETPKWINLNDLSK